MIRILLLLLTFIILYTLLYKIQNIIHRMFKQLTLFLLIITFSTTLKVSDFETWILKPSPPSGYHNVDTGNQTQGQILCIGDVNGDQYNDYIAYSRKDPYTLLAYLWNQQKSQFTSSKILLQKYKDTIQKVQQVMLSDLSDDGSLEVIVTYQKKSDNINDSILYNTVVYQVKDCHYYECSFVEYVLNTTGLSSMTAVPTLINVQTNSNSFLIFKDTHRQICQKTQGNIYITKNLSQYLNTDKRTNYNKVTKHFTSNIDFNGDCHADLVILSQKQNKSIVQFYQKQANSNLKLVHQITMGHIVKFITFVDFDASGTVDMLIVVGQTGKEYVQIVYNTNREAKQICQLLPEFPFDIRMAVNLTLPYPIASPPVLVFGDVDSDSYPDLLTIVTANQFRRPALYKNQEVDGVRFFKEATDLNANLISQVKNPRQVAFFDLGQDGKIDIFIMVEQTNDVGVSVITRTCFINNVKDDTLFIKILPLSQTSTYQSGSTKISNAFGITMQWRITKLDGYRKISLLNQKSQWNYGTLQLPFVSGGLGRTNNYVQDLTVGYQGMGEKMSWSPIIPNSKLLVFEKEKEWKLQTLLTNNQRVNQVIYVSVIILLVLGLVIFFLNYRENQQDKKDQYNFIQLIR